MVYVGCFGGVMPLQESFDGGHQSNFYGFIINGVYKEVVLITLKIMALLNTHCIGYWYFNYPSIVFLDIVQSNFTVALPNNGNKKMEYLAISQVLKL